VLSVRLLRRVFSIILIMRNQETDAPAEQDECVHVVRIRREAYRSDVAVRRGRSVPAKVAYLAAAETMEACRRECGEHSPFRNAEPLPPLPTPPPPIGEQLADWIRGWFRR
jgi:hypothetical protein